MRCFVFNDNWAHMLFPRGRTCCSHVGAIPTSDDMEQGGSREFRCVRGLRRRHCWQAPSIEKAQLTPVGSLVGGC